MGENRRASRFEIHVPVQLCASKNETVEFHIGQIRDISRTGILFQSQLNFEVGSSVELVFCLPTESGPSACVLVHASAKAVRTQELSGEAGPHFAIAVAIDRIDFLRPGESDRS